jgi:predicted RNA-binding protein associated with RNAse of E/G family
MKRKSVAKNATELADILNRLDGLRTGISRAEFRKAVKLINAVDIACRASGYRPVTAMMAKHNIKKANKVKAGK